MQTDYLYNIDDEDRDLHYTVALMADICRKYLPIEVWNITK